ncbi:MAG: sugar phosphate isomerase/epimerase [Alicyclobacillus sp.]|nr:sugar phosphate isomerase/epimerase [Alicyclobacillus sp.]
MKKGVNWWCFPDGSSLPSAFELARRAGFDGVELAMQEAGPLSPDASEQKWREIAGQAQAAGVEVCGVATAMHWQYSLTSGDPAVRRRGVDLAKRMVDAAAALGAGSVLVVPGLVDEQVPYDVAYDRAQQSLRSIAEYAAGTGVWVCVENVWNRFLLSPLEMRRFLDEVGHPLVQAYLDVGNVLQFGYPEQWLRILGPRVKRVHVKDFRRDIGNITGFTPLLQGDVNWRLVREALSDIGYDGYLTAEIPPYRSHPQQSLYDISAALNAIIQGV